MTGVYFCGPSLCQQCTHCTWLKCYWGMCTLAFTVTFPQCIMSTMHTLHMALVLLGNVHIGLHCNYWRTYTFWTRRGALVPSYRDGNFSSCTLPREVHTPCSLETDFAIQVHIQGNKTHSSVVRQATYYRSPSQMHIS